MTAPLLPPIPRVVYAPIGPIAVTLVADIDRAEPTAGLTTLGQWVAVERRIRLRRDLPLETLWATLGHEKMHAWLDDTGASNGLDHDAMERICDAAGLGLLADVRGRVR